MQKIRTGSEIIGAVSRIIYFDVESQFLIATLDSGVTIKGELETAEDWPGWLVGKRHRWLGRWVEHVRHGEQFEFSTYLEDRPLGRKATVEFLAKACDGIGPVKAGRLYDRYGDDTIHTLTHHPDQVAADGVLDHADAFTASAGLQSADGISRTKVELFGLLSGYGFPRRAINQLLERWGAKAHDFVHRNPFLPMVARIPGFGFSRCDNLYLDLGRPRHALKRQMLAAWYAITSGGDGNTWHHENILRKAMLDAVGDRRLLDVPRAIELGVRAGWLACRVNVNGQKWYAQAAHARDELDLARRLRALLDQGDPRWPDAVFNDPDLTAHQKGQLRLALAGRVGVLAGTPGTGKTFTTAKLIRSLLTAGTVAAAAPTGKAAVRLTENLQANGITLEATTIHRLLGVSAERDANGNYIFTHNEDKPLSVDFLFIDETSMVDTSLMGHLLKAAHIKRIHILFIGDPYQLPPVGHGAPLRDMIAAGVPIGELTEIQRNDGLIVQACAQIKEGKKFKVADEVDEDAGQNLRHLDASDPDTAQHLLRKVVQRFRENGRYDPIWETQVLVAVNEKSSLSRSVINPILQGVLNPITEGQRTGVSGFRIRDKVICLKNSVLVGFRLQPDKNPDNPDHYERLEEQKDAWSRRKDVEHFIANGEIGKCLAVSDAEAVFEFPPNRVVKIGFGPNSPHKGVFDLAYAITTHKSQGSEWPCVIVLGDRNGGQVTCREHLYTGISRAKRLCILLGEMAVFHRQIRKQTLTQRKTFLAELITREVADDDAEAEEDRTPVAVRGGN